MMHAWCVPHNVSGMPVNFAYRPCLEHTLAHAADSITNIQSMLPYTGVLPDCCHDLSMQQISLTGRHFLLGNIASTWVPMKIDIIHQLYALLAVLADIDLLCGCCLQGLSQYGNGFLAKFEAASCANKLLEEVTLVDTPGVLSGEKQRIERTYNFIDVCGWFAARCDLILLLFDPHKLDISDEFKQVCSLCSDFAVASTNQLTVHDNAQRTHNFINVCG